MLKLVLGIVLIGYLIVSVVGLGKFLLAFTPIPDRIRALLRRLFPGKGLPEKHTDRRRD